MVKKRSIFIYIIYFLLIFIILTILSFNKNFFGIKENLYKLKKINLNPDNSIKNFLIADKNQREIEVEADAYVSALPVDLFKLLSINEGINFLIQFDNNNKNTYLKYFE